MLQKISIAILIIVTILAGIGTYVHYLMEPGREMAREVMAAKVRLLCETDHQVLLDACREFSRKHLNGELDTNDLLRSTHLPEVVAALRPHDVVISPEGVVTICMYGGWWPLGVHAYPAGHPEPRFGYGDRQLLEGLWYFEDGYSTHPEDYDRRIDELLSKGGKLKKSGVNEAD